MWRYSKHLPNLFLIYDNACVLILLEILAIGFKKASVMIILLYYKFRL